MTEPVPGPAAGTDAPPPAAPPPAAAPPGVDPSASQDDRTYAVFVHLSGIPPFFLLGPLVLWLLKKDQSAYVDHHGKEALNFQITVLAAAALLAATMCLPIVGTLAALASGALWIVALVLMVIAAVEASKGMRWRYPISLRLIG